MKKSTLLRACIIFMLILCVSSVILAWSAFQTAKRDYKDLVKNTGIILSHTMKEVQQIANVIMLNADIQRFVSHPQVEGGSEDIQVLIDAQKNLMAPQLTYPIIETVYIYSKSSDYLLSAENVFFSINQMYEPLIAFDILNSGQWRQTYLRPKHTQHWMPYTTAIVNGSSLEVIPFVQSFPLTNPSANSGKIIVLCKTSFFDDIMSLFSEYKQVNISIENKEGALIYSNVDSISPDTYRVNNLYKVVEPLSEIEEDGYSFVVSVPKSAIIASMRKYAMCFVFFVSTVIVLLFIDVRCKNALRKRNHFKVVKSSFSSLHDKESMTFERIDEYVQVHYNDPLLNLSQMAHDFNTKENFLYYFFKTKIKESFSSYLENYRLKQALAFIEKDINSSVVQLAKDCGYSNAQTFRRAFKKKYGFTPSEYKIKIFCNRENL